MAKWTGPETNLKEPPEYTTYGPVQTDTKGSDYHGATQKTNNTGELSGMHAALKHSLALPKNTFIVIHSDSSYSIRAAVSTHKPKKNGKLVHTVRKALKEARKKFGWKNIQMSHVKGLSDHPRNDVADDLATKGLGATERFEKTHTYNTGIT